MDTVFNPKGKLIIEKVLAWMDGGSVTLSTRDSELSNFEIEFVQKISLVRNDYSSCPGSLLLDKKEVKIRSVTESTILASVQGAEWGSEIVEAEKKFLKEMITECVDFVISDKYIEIARSMGRID